MLSLELASCRSAAKRWAGSAEVMGKRGNGCVAADLDGQLTVNVVPRPTPTPQTPCPDPSPPLTSIKRTFGLVESYFYYS